MYDFMWDMPYNITSTPFMWGSPLGMWDNNSFNIWGNSSNYLTPKNNFRLNTVFDFGFQPQNNWDTFGLFGSSPWFSTKPQQRVVQKTPETKTITEADISRINGIKDNTKKIAEWLKIKPTEKNYAILDKKNCTITVYDSTSRKPLRSFEVGIGRQSGDTYNDGYGHANHGKTKTTPAGEFSIASREFKNDYGHYFRLDQSTNTSGNNKSFVSLHRVPTSMEKERLGKFDNGILKDNQMSSGCINFQRKDMQQLRTMLDVGSQVFILPEETGNSLALAQQKDGTYKFEQTKYKHDHS